MNTTTARQATAGRRTIGALRNLLAAAARYGVTAPAPAATQQAAPATSRPVPIAERHQADLFAAEEMPPAADIAAAAEQYMRAAEQARAADRAKRDARKLLDRLPAGRYGAWNVERVDNAREVADLDAIRAIFAAHGLGEVPMRRVTPSLTVALAAELVPVAALVAA